MAAQSVKDIKKELYLMLHKGEEMLGFTEEAFKKNKSSSLDMAAELGKEIHAKEDALTEALAKMASADSEARAILSVPAQVEKAKANPKLAGWFVGQVMKATGGKANPKAVNQLISKKLSS